MEIPSALNNNDFRSNLLFDLLNWLTGLHYREANINKHKEERVIYLTKTFHFMAQNVLILNFEKPAALVRKFKQRLQSDHRTNLYHNRFRKSRLPSNTLICLKEMWKTYDTVQLRNQPEKIIRTDFATKLELAGWFTVCISHSVVLFSTQIIKLFSSKIFWRNYTYSEVPALSGILLQLLFVRYNNNQLNKFGFLTF